MIFINNKYTKWYYSIITNAKSRTISGYTETHHIIPRSMGGTNDLDNLVKLTAKEHFICHLILTKMTTGKDYYRMSFALNMLSNVKNIGKGRYTPNSRTYDYAKRLHIAALANYWTVEKRKEHSAKISAAVKANPQSEETKAKISAAAKGKEWTEKAIANRLNNCLKSAAARKGKPQPEKKIQSTLNTYLRKNVAVAMQVFILHDAGFNNLQISKEVDISWDRVKYALIHRNDFETFQQSLTQAPQISHK
jgi:hypothetical protein